MTSINETIAAKMAEMIMSNLMKGNNHAIKVDGLKMNFKLDGDVEYINANKEGVECNDLTLPTGELNLSWKSVKVSAMEDLKRHSTTTTHNDEPETDNDDIIESDISSVIESTVGKFITTVKDYSEGRGRGYLIQTKIVKDYVSEYFKDIVTLDQITRIHNLIDTEFHTGINDGLFKADYTGLITGILNILK